MFEYYLKDGSPCSLEDGCSKFSDESYKRVGLDVVRKLHPKIEEDTEYRISTVWLGLNHNYREGPPLIFETMIFDGNNNSDLFCERYATLAEAELGHRKAVEGILRGELP